MTFSLPLRRLRGCDELGSLGLPVSEAGSITKGAGSDCRGRLVFDFDADWAAFVLLANTPVGFLGGGFCVVASSLSLYVLELFRENDGTRRTAGLNLRER